MNASSIPFIAALALASVIAFAAGCAKDESAKIPKPDERELNEASVRASFAHQIAAGTRTDRTIYAHHFIIGEAALNELGRRQIDVLTAEVTTRALKVNIPQGDSDETLHEARVQIVRDRLAGNGVEPERIAVVDEHPGGPGLTTAVIVAALDDQGGRSGGGTKMWGYSSKTGNVGGGSGGGSGGNAGGGGSGSNSGGTSSGGGGGGGGGSAGSGGYGR